MDPDEIRDTILEAIYSNEKLKDELVLKGGNALRIYGVTNRSSQDLDFSIKESIKYTTENEGELLKKVLTEKFKEKGFYLNSYKFIDRPKKRDNKIPPFWGGYIVTFSIIDAKKYQDKIDSNRDNPNINKYGEDLENGVKKIELDFSYEEYTEGKISKNWNGVKIYLYSPLMIIYEKIRASCQQLEGYELTSVNKVRGRDLYDIFTMLTTYEFIDLREEILNPINYPILKKIFSVKKVPLVLMNNLSEKKESLKYDYMNNVIPQISLDEDIPDFDYLFEYNDSLFKELYKNIIDNE